jgi:hypothetical protein
MTSCAPIVEYIDDEVIVDERDADDGMPGD